jgi:LEA14-like dessication related protein
LLALLSDLMFAHAGGFRNARYIHRREVSTVVRSSSFLPLLVICIASGCASLIGSLEPPEVYVTSLAPLDASLFEQRLRIDLRIRNPNNAPLEISGIEFELDVNGAPLARGLSNEEITVPRLGESVISVVASTTLTDLARQIVQLGSQRSLDYSLRGRVHLGGLRNRTLPFERSRSEPR